MTAHALSPQAREFIEGDHPLLIGGEWVRGQGADIPIENPASETVLTTIRAASTEQLDHAVAAARAALNGVWRRMNVRERGLLLNRFAALIERDAGIIAEIMTAELGQTLASSRGVAGSLSPALFRYYAGWTDKITGEAFDPIVGADVQQFMAVTIREPIGVVGAIIPWNASPGMMGLKLAPSLAAGCTVVLKPAELAPLCASYFARLWQEAGGPPGSLNVVHGHGATIGAAMASHDGIDKITFTGSTAVGKAIVVAAAGNLKKVTLELGGKSPFIVFPDVDVEAVARTAASWCFVASGQACIAATRVFVHADIHDRFVEVLGNHTRNLIVGDPTDPATNLGPLVSAAQKQRVAGYIASAKAEGARMVCGDEPVPDIGHYVRPAVFTEVDPAMRIAREEIFGPVMSVIRFDDEQRMLDTVNDTPFGLSGSVWTRDLERALRVARRIDAGQIGVNVHGPMSPQTPFGGNKQSGWGREFARNGLEEFLKIKAITIRIGDRP